MPVYIIRAGEHGPVKIGWTDVIVTRLSKMQIDNHETLILLRLFDGGRAEERQLHQRFADLHLHGEWHSYSKAMLGDVGLTEQYVADAADKLKRQFFKLLDTRLVLSQPTEPAA